MKQEMKRETDQNLMVATTSGVNMNQVAPFWPIEYGSVPIPVSNASINHYDLNMMNPSASAIVSNAIANNGSSSSQQSYIFQGFENFPNDLTELVCVNPQQMEGFYGMESMDMSNGSSTITTSTESSSWGDMNSLVYSPLVSDYEGCCPQGIIPQQHIAFEESKYFGMQLQ